MRILFYSDRHVHDRGSGPFTRGDSLLDVHRASAGWVCEQIRALRPDFVVDGGDSYEQMGTLPVGVLQVCESTLMEIMDACESVGSQFYYVLGNHDLHGNFHSIPLVNKIVDDLWADPVVDVGDRRLHFWHWRDGGDQSVYESLVSGLRDGDIVFSHNAIMGYALGPSVVERRGLDFRRDIRHVLDRGVTVCSGHYHRPAHHRYPGISGYVDVFLPGSLTARSFKDHFNPKFPRGILVLDVGSEGVSVRRAAGRNVIRSRAAGRRDRIEHGPGPLGRLRAVAGDPERRLRNGAGGGVGIAPADVPLRGGGLHRRELPRRAGPVGHQQHRDRPVQDRVERRAGVGRHRHVLVPGPYVEHRIRCGRRPPLKRVVVGIGIEVAAGLAVPVVERGDVSQQQQARPQAVDPARRQQADPVGGA